MQPENSWQVRLDQDSELIWMSGEETLTKQPAQSCWQRFQNEFLNGRKILQQNECASGCQITVISI